MSKISILLIGFICTLNPGFSQNDNSEPEFVNVNWKAGTEKTISQVDSTIIYNLDSIFMSTGVSSNYTIKVVNQHDTIYDVLFKQINIDENIVVESELINTNPIELIMKDLIMDIQKKMLGFEYSFLVSKNTASAFEVKNQTKLIRLIEEMIVVVLNKYLDVSKVELDDTEKHDIQLKIKQYMNEQMPAAIQTMLNSFNYIFQAYSFPYIIDEIYTSEIEVYSIDQVQHGDKEMTAGLVVKSSIKESELIIDYQYEYDKQAAYQDYIVAQGQADQISFDQFDINERVVSHFDLVSSWITSSSSFIKVKMGNIMVYKTTHIKIE